jgi:hypothetical protein
MMGQTEADRRAARHQEIEEARTYFASKPGWRWAVLRSVFNAAVARIAGLALLVVLFWWLVWPTPWIYGHDSQFGPFRTHRITGRVEIMDENAQWVRPG